MLESARLKVSSMRAASSQIRSCGVMPSAFLTVDGRHLIDPPGWTQRAPTVLMLPP